MSCLRGYERTKAQWMSVLDASGWHLDRVIELTRSSAFKLLEASLK